MSVKQMFHTKNMMAVFFPLLLVVFLTLPIVSPFFYKGYFPTHDGEWAVVRLGEMYREIKDLQIPPRYSTNLNFGHGYPLFNFAYPLPYYLGMLFFPTKIGFITTIKLLFILSTLVSAIGMFLLSRKLWGTTIGAFMSILLFIYWPYRIVDLYARGSLGETVAFAFFPFLLYFCLQIVSAKRSLFPFIAAIFCLAGLILAHNIMALLFMFVLLPFMFFLVKGNKTLLIRFGFILCFGFALSAFFWFPALYEKQYILLSKVPIADRNLYFVTLQELVTHRFGYGMPTDKENGFSYQIGWPQITIFLFVIISQLFYKQKRNRVVLMLLFLIAVMLFLLFSPSAFIWKTMPLLSEINYPWTLLGPIGFSISLLAGYIGQQKKAIQLFGLLLSISAIALFLPYARPEKQIYPQDTYYLTNDAPTTSSFEYMPLWVKKWSLHRPTQEIVSKNSSLSTTNVFISSNKIQAKVVVKGNTTLQLQKIYYPGWHIFVNGKEQKVTYTNPTGFMEFPIKKGTHTIYAVFTETPMRILANMVSLGTLCFLAVLVIFPKLYYRYVT